jgi:hypothetical protein
MPEPRVVDRVVAKSYGGVIVFVIQTVSSVFVIIIVLLSVSLLVDVLLIVLV